MPTIYSVTISASDLGSRIMVRRILPDGLGDVIGDLLAWTDEAVTIATRTGPVTVALETIVAGKLVPPARPRRRPRSGGGGD